MLRKGITMEAIVTWKFLFFVTISFAACSSDSSDRSQVAGVGITTTAEESNSDSDSQALNLTLDDHPELSSFDDICKKLSFEFTSKSGGKSFSEIVNYAKTVSFSLTSVGTYSAEVKCFCSENKIQQEASIETLTLK